MPQQSPTARTADLPYLPPPPPPGNVLDLLRWSLVVLRASTGRNRAAIRRHQNGPGGSESLGTVAIAIGADLAMLAAKAAAAALTGSAALFAETLHSLADTGNQLLLLTGLRRARRRPDARHPFGYGAELFYWSLLAALGIFAVGGVLSAWEGMQRLLHPSAMQAGAAGFCRARPRLPARWHLMAGLSAPAPAGGPGARRAIPAAPPLDHRYRGHRRLLRGLRGAGR